MISRLLRKTLGWHGSPIFVSEERRRIRDIDWTKVFLNLIWSNLQYKSRTTEDMTTDCCQHNSRKLAGMFS